MQLKRALLLFSLSTTLLWPSTLFSQNTSNTFSYTFLFIDGKTKEELSLKIQPPYFRIDRPKELFSIIYNEREDSFVGLEHRDGRYWKFYWPQIQKAVQKTKESSYKIKSDPFTDPIEQSIEEVLNPPLSTHYGRFEPFNPPPQIPWEQSSLTRNSSYGELSQWIAKNTEGQSVCWLGSFSASEMQHWDQSIGKLRKVCQILSFLLGEYAWPPKALDLWSSLPKNLGIPVETYWRQENKSLQLFLIRKELLSNTTWIEPPKNYMIEELPLLEEYKNE
ncbi:hypothetical protein A7Q09_08325 [Methylacidiphilum sp. Yel]|nr:hypothetical protein A7Q09_08325 [Methylacidiphilum sp. Yel]